MPEVTIIAAVAQNRAIGCNNRLLYRLSADMKRFKSLTVGHTVLMGRKTFESLPKGALPDRRNIVVSRNKNADFHGCEVFPSIESALSACSADEKVFIIGGASVYAETMDKATHLSLTLVHDTPEHADVFFPEFDRSQWKEMKRESHPADERNEKPFDFVEFDKIEV